MARSSPEYYDATLADLQFVAKKEIYDLAVISLPYLGEIWVCRREVVSAVSAMSELQINSPAWHHARARLRGIPAGEVDEQFHLRQGYGERTMP